MINTEKGLDAAVKEIMTTDVFTVEVTDKVQDVRKLMTNKHVRHAPVLRDGQLVGIISLTDLQRMTFTDTYGEEELDADDAVMNMFNAGMVMHKDPETISPESSLREVVEIFVNREFHALPVTDENNKLAGIITTTDVLKFVLSL